MLDNKAIYECSVCKHTKRVDRDFSDSGRSVFCCGKIMQLRRAATVQKGNYGKEKD